MSQSNDVISVFKLRKERDSPSFFESDRSPGIYHEFLEFWMRNEDGTISQLKGRSSNVEEPDVPFGAYRTGRRFELFDCVTPEFLEDMGITDVLPGMHQVIDPGSLIIYRFRIV